jgi:N-acetylmuramoyl-L-alanine amidase
VIGDPRIMSRGRVTRAQTRGPLVALLCLAFATPQWAQDTAAPAALTLVSKDGRRTIPTITSNGREMIGLDDVASLFQVTVREDSLAGGFTMTYRGKTIVASADQPMASVDRRIVTLPSPITRAGRRWLVPIEFLPRALGPIYDQRIDLRRAARLLLVGDVRVPRVSARVDTPGPPTRAAIVITPATPVTVSNEAGRLVLRVDADALEPVFPVTATGLIDGLRIGDQPNVVVVALSRQAGMPRTTMATADNATRVAIEIPFIEPRPPTPDPKPPTTGPLPPTSESTTRLPGIEPRQALQTLAIDPGHGGDEIGVRGPDGLEEKQLTLDVARRLRGLVERGLGLRVILTRDDDRLVGIDERAAAANNSKADLLLSLHANGALSGSPSGAEIYYERLDREGEAVRLSAAAAVSLPVISGGTRSIDVVPWDLAQARHIDASAMLASVLARELRQRIPMGQRPVQQGPMRLLSAANMPAVLVEMAYLTNSAQAKAAAGDEFKNAVAQALYNAIVRFRGYLEETSAP